MICLECENILDCSRSEAHLAWDQLVFLKSFFHILENKVLAFSEETSAKLGWRVSSLHQLEHLLRNSFALI